MGVLHTFRKRLSVGQALRFADILPPLRRAMSVEDWSPRDAVQNSRGARRSSFEQDTRGSNIGAAWPFAEADLNWCRTWQFSVPLGQGNGMRDAGDSL